MDILLVTALVVLMVIPPIFIWHHVYKDGVIGRIALAGVALFAFVRIAIIIDSDNDSKVPGDIVLLLVFAAAFIAWHLWRFHSRVLRARSDPRVTFDQSVPR